MLKEEIAAPQDSGQTLLGFAIGSVLLTFGSLTWYATTALELGLPAAIGWAAVLAPISVICTVSLVGLIILFLVVDFMSDAFFGVPIGSISKPILITIVFVSVAVGGMGGIVLVSLIGRGKS